MAKRQRYGEPNRVQLKAMLEYMGMPLNEQPSKLVDVKKLLNVARQNDQEKYNKIHKVLVLGMDPEAVGGKDDKDLYDAQKIVQLVNEHFSDKVNQATARIDRSVLDATAELSSSALKIAQNAIAEAAKQYQTIQVRIGDQKPKKVSGVVPEWFEKALQLAQSRKNILLVGPAGCGKTHMASKIAEAFGLDFASQSCSAGMSESQLTGWLLPTGSNAKFVYTMAQFVRIYENGGVFLFDELDSSDPNVLIYINQALAQDEFYLPIRHDNPKVKKHKDFIAVAAANTFGTGADAMYHARNALDAATLDRFRIGVIPVDYSPVVEDKLIDDEVLSWGRDVRGKINRNRLQKVMSTRFLIDATDMKRNQKWSMEEIASTYFADWTGEEKRIVGVR